MSIGNNYQLTSPAAQLMAIEVISELLASTSPHKLGEALTAHLRELTGARTVMVLIHHPEPEADELLYASPLRRNTLFSPTELNNFCHECTPGELPCLPEELSPDHPLYTPLVRAGVQSVIRYPLHAGGELIGQLLLFDLPGVERVTEASHIINLLAAPIALALKNALAFRLIEQQAQELEQRVAERTEELQEAQALFKTAVSSSPFPIMIFDEDGHILQLSQGWTDLSGYSLEEIPTIADWTERAYGERSGSRNEYIETLFEIDRTVNNGEWELTAKDGSIRIWEFQTTPLRTTRKGVRVLLSMATDLTERKNTEEARIQLEAQLQQAQKMESVGRLAGGVAHDFNNMLTVILGHAELGLVKLDPNHPVRADLQEISQTAQRSADLTRQLLAFARRQTVAPKVLDLNEIITAMLKMLQRLIGEGIHLTWQPSASLWPVMMDPSQVDQILANLCVNARDAIRDIGRITIETGNRTFDKEYCDANPEATPGEYVRLSVSDDGHGMDKETLLHIFEPFYTTKELGKGTGLGLATIYGAVKQNNGFINIYSEPGQGTTFSIYLPRHEGQKNEKPAKGTALTVPRGQETILVVEDEPAILKITSIMLEKQGYTVIQAATPGEAICLAREHAGEITLLMTDVIMPEMNGRDLAKNVQSLYPHIKRLFMSGYTADVIAHHGVLDEGVHFIQKPFSLPDMAAKVRDVLDSK
ncbi:MAG: hybrid sensor histidine kinase/response regulator [Desulfuromonadaceae bacterium]